MKRLRWLFALLPLLMVLVLPVGVAAQEAEITEIPLYVNPAYRGLVDEAFFDFEGVCPQEPLAEPTYVDAKTAAENLRQYMKYRADTISVYIKAPYDTSLDRSALFAEVFYDAVAHTGNPTEGDYLYKHWGGYSGSISTKNSGGYYWMTFTYYMKYYTTLEQEEELDTAVSNLLEELDLYNCSDYEKVKGIYDYMTNNIVYDYDNLNDSSYMLKYTAYAALVDGKSVCQGYANLFYRLALELGVDNRLIWGTADNGQSIGGHAWNIVKLGNCYYNVDATWDQPRAYYNTPYEYFLLGSESFTTDHFEDTDFQTAEFTAAFPVSETDYFIGSGYCGNEAQWQLTSEGDLYVFGTGPMYDFAYSNANATHSTHPWAYCGSSVKRVVVEEGITSLGVYAFYNCKNLTSVTLANTVETIGKEAFSGTGLTAVTIPESVTTLGAGAFYYCLSLKTITFQGDAPAISGDSFLFVTANAEYPADNATWTTDKLKSYGGTLTWVPYGTVEPEAVVKASGLNLRLQDLLKLGFYFTAESEQEIVNAGALLWTAEEYATETDFTVTSTIAKKYSGLEEVGGAYAVETDGIYAQYLDTVFYFIPYVETEYGIVYGNAVSSSALTYTNMIYNGTNYSADLKSLVVDLLNYGTAARTYFGYSEGIPAPEQAFNAGLSEADRTVTVTDDMKAGVRVISESDTGFSPAVVGVNTNLNEAIQLNLIFEGDSGVEQMLYWTEEDYNAATVHDATTATGVMPLTESGTAVYGSVKGIYGFQMYDNLYMRAVDGEGNLSVTYVAAVASYLTTALSQYENATTEENVAFLQLVNAMMVYGDNAKSNPEINKN